MQIAFAAVASQSCRHRRPQSEKRHPETQVQEPNLGRPPPLYTSPKNAAVIISPGATCQQIFVSEVRATRQINGKSGRDLRFT